MDLRNIMLSEKLQKTKYIKINNFYVKFKRQPGSVLLSIRVCGKIIFKKQWDDKHRIQDNGYL